MKKRESNFELLRIISMLMIVAFHCVFKSGFSLPGELGVNSFIIYTFWLLGELGVNIFILISGYFMIKGSFKIHKFIDLIMQVIFYSALSYLLSCLLTDVSFSMLDFALNLIPRYWFVRTYLLIYIISPYLNKFLTRLSKKNLRILLLVCLVIWCIVPTIFGVFKKSTEDFFFYNRNIWLIMVYCVGAYIRLFHTQRKTSKFYWVLTSVFFVLLVLSIPIFNYFGKSMNINAVYFWTPNNIVTFCLSLCLFIAFFNLKVTHNKTINLIASASFGVYLLHDGCLSKFIWSSFNVASYIKSPTLIIRILLSVILIYVGGFAVDIIYRTIKKYSVDILFDKYENYKIIKLLNKEFHSQ